MPHIRFPGLSRRDFVRGTLASAATLSSALGAIACTTEAGGIPHAWRTPALLDALGPERVRRIGAAWREQHADERSPSELMTALRRRLPAFGPERQNAPADAIWRAIADDFETNRLVIVDGWMLAVTEARQCALYHVSHV